MNVQSVYSRGGNHPYEGFLVDGSENLEEIAKKIKRILTDTETAETLVENFETIGLTGFSVDTLNEIAILDLPDEHYEEWRVGEALAQVLLEDNYDCVLPFSKEANTTNHNTSNTGIDLLGLTSFNTSGMLILFAEVKTSSAEAAPPSAIHGSKKTSLTNQLKDILKQKKKRHEHMRYMLKELGTTHSLLPQFVEATKELLNNGKYAVFGVAVRDTNPDKNDLEKTSNSLRGDTECDTNSATLLSLHVDSMSDLSSLVKEAEVS